MNGRINPGLTAPVPDLTRSELRAWLTALGVGEGHTVDATDLAVMAIQKDSDRAVSLWGTKVLAMLAVCAKKNETPVQTLVRLMREGQR